jgi:hypothetical protein
MRRFWLVSHLVVLFGSAGAFSGALLSSPSPRSPDIEMTVIKPQLVVVAIARALPPPSPPPLSPEAKVQPRQRRCECLRCAHGNRATFDLGDDD